MKIKQLRKERSDKGVPRPNYKPRATMAVDHFDIFQSMRSEGKSFQRIGSYFGISREWVRRCLQPSERRRLDQDGKGANGE